MVPLKKKKFKYEHAYEKRIVLNFVKEGVKKINDYEKYKNDGLIYANLDWLVNTHYSRSALPSTNALLILIQIEKHVKWNELKRKNVNDLTKY